eukprot:1156892-Pelagomonas_calceolata.AAC.12
MLVCLVYCGIGYLAAPQEPQCTAAGTQDAGVILLLLAAPQEPQCTAAGTQDAECLRWCSARRGACSACGGAMVVQCSQWCTSPAMPKYGESEAGDMYGELPLSINDCSSSNSAMPVGSREAPRNDFCPFLPGDRSSSHMVVLNNVGFAALITPKLALALLRASPQFSRQAHPGL